MRLVILKDKRIKDEELEELQRQFTDLYYKYVGITPEYYVEERDYSHVPVEPDRDGDLKPTRQYFKAMTDDIYKRYGEFGTDHIIMLVHERNWIFDGIWGTNLSNVFHTYHLELCRFDADNVANSLGTLYHEVMHSHDALIKTTIGFDVDTLGLAPRWDKYCVHGGRPDMEGMTKWRYIRYMENTEALAGISEYLYKSYEKRRKLHRDYLNRLNLIINLLQKVVILYRRLLNIKDGVPKG